VHLTPRLHKEWAQAPGLLIQALLPHQAPGDFRAVFPAVLRAEEEGVGAAEAGKIRKYDYNVLIVDARGSKACTLSLRSRE